MAKRKSVSSPLHAWVLHMQSKFNHPRKGWDGSGNRVRSFWDALDGRPQKMRGDMYPEYYYMESEFDLVDGEVVSETLISFSEHARPNGDPVTYVI